MQLVGGVPAFFRRSLVPGVLACARMLRMLLSHFTLTDGAPRFHSKLAGVQAMRDGSPAVDLGRPCADVLRGNVSQSGAAAG